MEKKPFKTIRTSVYEKRKFPFLPKSIVFIKNVSFIQLLFLSEIDQEKVSGYDQVRKKVFCTSL